MTALLDIAECIKDRCHVGTRLVADVLRTYKPRKGGLDKTSKNMEMLYIEEITTYNDHFRSVSEAGQNNRCYIIRTKGSADKILTMFEPQFDRVATRTLQQKLGDVTTAHILTDLGDKDFVKMFAAFHKPMAKVLSAYAKLRKLRTPQDVALFYKGGNMFRIVLADLIKLIDDKELEFLLKRSDADFQIFINPDIENLEKVREDIRTLVLFVLYSLKAYIRNGSVIRVRHESNSMASLVSAYQNEIESVVGTRPRVDVNAQVARRFDFMVSRRRVLPNDTTEYVLLKEYDTLLENMPPNHSSYFVSMNTSLDFKRRDNLRCTFDLIRFRRNVRLHIDIDGGVDINAPFEIIDVSIPKGDDYGLQKLRANAPKLLKEYNYGENLRFLAPSVEYLLLDLHDLLFKQNEYPWTDIKYIKRMMRYFLTMVVFTIVENLETGDDDALMSKDIGVMARDFMRFARKLKHRMFLDEGWEIRVLRTLLRELRHLKKKVLYLESKDGRAKEGRNLEKFVDDLVASFAKLSHQLFQMSERLDSTAEALMRKRYVSLFKSGRSQVM